MASIAEEIVDYLVTQTIGTKGTTLFYNEWAPNVDAATTDVVVIARGGGEGFRQSPPVLLTVDIWVRGPSFTACDSKAGEVFNVLNSDTLIQLTSSRIMACVCMTPGDMGRDPQ
ncbi:MAG: hypothetical protein ACREJC_08095, partial [Tepidisphaeraceae bacterium]